MDNKTVLKMFGLDEEQLKYEDMNKQERETYNQWLLKLSANQITLPDVVDYIKKCRDAVETELVDTPETERFLLFFSRPSRKAVLLRGRLRNYMLLEAMMTSAERAKVSIEKALRQAK